MENKIKDILEKIPGIKSVDKIEIEDKIIKYICVEKELMGKLMIQSLSEEDGSALYEFYLKGLSEKSRNFFPPYPLFSPLPKSSNDLTKRIIDWKKETDWTVLKLLKKKKIIGVCLLKRFKTKRPTSGLAIEEEFHKTGLGTLLQTVINEQVRLLEIKKLYITAAQDNIASLELHKKCGFVETGKLVPHFIYKDKIKEIDRYDVEMVKRFN